MSSIGETIEIITAGMEITTTNQINKKAKTKYRILFVLTRANVK